MATHVVSVLDNSMALYPFLLFTDFALLLYIFFVLHKRRDKTIQNGRNLGTRLVNWSICMDVGLFS